MRKTLVLTLCVLAFTACSTTQQASLKQADRSTLARFSRMSPGPEGGASLRYINPNAQWTRYKKVMITPVTFWAGSDATVSPADQHALCDFFYQALLTQAARQGLEVVNSVGPAVLKVDVAVTDAESATPVFRTVSMLVPQARALATLKYLATGTYPFIGGAQVESRLSDAETGAVLGEFADRRVGGGSIATAAQWKWGDAENAINQWASLAATRLASWMSGSAKP